jgi:hypothetical protein
MLATPIKLFLYGNYYSHVSKSKSGRDRTVSDDELLGAVRDVDYPAVLVSDVAARVSIGDRAVYNRLENLVDRGVLNRRKARENFNYYWQP